MDRLGSQGVVAQTHFDEAPNFATQVIGHKRWILSPPSEAPKLYSPFLLFDYFLTSDPT